jgi:hypothetical protein
MSRPITDDIIGLKVLVDGNGSGSPVECATLYSLASDRLLKAEVSLRSMGGVHIQMTPGACCVKTAWRWESLKTTLTG